MKKALIIDTSVLCCWLRIPGREVAGPAEDRWDHDRIDALIKKEIADGGLCVLPIATLIETGNHVSQSPDLRFELATQLSEIIRKTANGKEPWAAFTQQSVMWDQESLIKLANEFPQFAVQKLSIGDVTIKNVADYYATLGCAVEILTGDHGLRAHNPLVIRRVPRRRE